MCVETAYGTRKKSDKEQLIWDKGKTMDRLSKREKEKDFFAGLNQMRKEFRTREEVHARQPWGK